MLLLKRIGHLAAIFILVICFRAAGQKAGHTFTLGDTDFLLDGKPLQVISGEMHYPRVPREAWRQRMRMAKAMGLNTISTYVFWDLHEPQKGHYDFTGNNDIAQFVKTAQQEGLYVILRPSPYVCAEWEFGGYPYWLEKEKGLTVRSKESQYIEAYKKYLMQVGKQLSPLLINHGGNILMIQIENEYGSYGNDKSYLELNRKIFIDAGFDGLLYTCDPEPAIKDGHLPGLLPAINGVDNVAKVKKLIADNHDGKGPFMIAEWYPAWFDWWGTQHHTVSPDTYLPKLDSVLAAGISINMYMFHGGTTRGFMNGANFNDQSPYEPEISSYDYEAPLNEAGNATDKFLKFREVIKKHLPVGETIPDVPAAKPVIKIADIKLGRSAGLFDILPPSISNSYPLTFEDINQAYGFVLYRTKLNGGTSGILKIDGLKDYGLIFINGKRIGVLDRRLKQDSLMINLPNGEVTLDILVENLGRINFGPYLLKNKKGITDKVLFAGKELKNWKMFGLPFDHVPVIKTVSVKKGSNAPMLKTGYFTLNKVADTYLDMRTWGKGIVWINGHNLGRYWAIGPQQTLYVPAEWLKTSHNKIMIFELLTPDQNVIKTIKRPILSALKTDNKY